MTLLRRFLAIVALLFWQGGFTFYAAVVVPIGQNVLGSHLEQGLITRQVTHYLNISGAAAMALLAAELLAEGYPRSWRLGLLWFIWLGMAVLLGALIVLHPALDTLIDLEAHSLSDRGHFRALHRTYLWISTFDWGLAAIYLWLMLKNWKEREWGA